MGLQRVDYLVEYLAEYSAAAMAHTMVASWAVWRVVPLADWMVCMLVVWTDPQRVVSMEQCSAAQTVGRWAVSKAVHLADCSVMRLA